LTIYRGSITPGQGSTVRGNADEIDIADVGNIIDATNVEDALQENRAAIDADEAALATHIADTTTHGTTGDVVGTSDTQTLTNKDLDDTTTEIVDTADATKKIVFDAGGTTATKTTITAAQTADRIVTLPDATDTLVGKDTTDTLTNKTLTSPDINAGTADDLTALSVAADSDGNVSRWVMTTATGGVGTEDGANTWAKLATFDGDASTVARFAVTLELTSVFYNAGQDTTSTKVAIQILDAAGGLSSNSTINIVGTTGSAISHDSFKLVQATASQGTPIELWVRKDTSYQSFYVTEIGRHDLNDSVDVAYNPNAAWQSATPSGAVNITSDWAGGWIAFTPYIYGTTVSGVGTYATQVGYYRYYNGFMEFALTLAWTAHTGTGNMRVGGFPKSSASIANTSIIVGYADYTVTLEHTALFSASSDYIILYDNGTAVSMDTAASVYLSGRVKV
jgi:hypothetical protein